MEYMGHWHGMAAEFSHIPRFNGGCTTKTDRDIFTSLEQKKPPFGLCYRVAVEVTGNVCMVV
jgi:hypothetical protein